MNRLTTDNPGCSNYLTLMNYCKSKNSRATLCWADGNENVDLAEYTAKCCNENGCDSITADYIMENGFECDCVVATMYCCGVQAAENNARLSKYEDTGLTPDEIIKTIESYKESSLSQATDNYNLEQENQKLKTLIKREISLYHCLHCGFDESLKKSVLSKAVLCPRCNGKMTRYRTMEDSK